MVALAQVTLDDKYRLDTGYVFLTGIQALVRLPMMQQRRDRAHGYNTAGFISGYRGSPLGAYDQQLTRARTFLEAHQIKFQPGVNEDLAATAVWGTQQAELHGEGSYDGVFSIWYGKGPGVDRSGDALRHGNLAGSSRLGGVLALLGDDHTCESSTTAHQSEFAMVDAMIPILNPAGVREILDFGLYGWAMSRYSGCWTALKCMHDTVEASASVNVDDNRVRIALPDDATMPPGGLNIRWPDTPQEQEVRLHEHKLEAVRAFCRANRLDRAVMDNPNASIGIVTTGKSYLDVRQALDDLGINADKAKRIGLGLYKVAMSWPLEPQGIQRFCEGLDLAIVVEEKRGLIETQIKELLYAQPRAPRIIGKRDENGDPLFSSAGRLDTNRIATVIGQRVLQRGEASEFAARLRDIERREQHDPESAPLIRLPYFCAGCPHNTSTRVPEGSRALAGIGCHYMAQWMDRETARFTQMGAEGASWIGEAPFSRRAHVFQNIGDGTYFHSGMLAIRATIAAGTNITFKILYNDAVAMTGGQAIDGPLTVPRITQQVHAEGVERIAVVSDEPQKYARDSSFAPGTTVHHRDELDAVQRELRAVKGTTVLVYDQTCAAEKRRRRKRGLFPDPPKRAFINEAVCEGCGDCGLQSNCVAIVPLATEFGLKRTIDQSACNKDFSCLKGFCPSFVTVHGGKLKKNKPDSESASSERVSSPLLPEPETPELDDPYSIVVTGVGGTGVVTIGALIGMAAHLEGKGCSVLDMIGLAQKGGAVVSHVRVVEHPEFIQTTRIAAGGARLVLGCDIVVTASADALKTVESSVTHVIANTHEVMVGDFTRDSNLSFPSAQLKRLIKKTAGEDSVDFLDATQLATALLGDSIATNLFMLGYAYQKGHIPLGAEAIERAIELNAVAVEMNKQAFQWGRHAAVDLTAVQATATPAKTSSEALPRPSTLDELITQRADELVVYQDTSYARLYRQLVDRVRETEGRQVKGQRKLTEAVARYYFKLMAYKDEYEVARLYTNGDFLNKLHQQFEGDLRLEFHLAPPVFAHRDRRTGELQKRRYGTWVFSVFKVLAKLRRLRGSKLDIFGYSKERQTERALIQEYERTVSELCKGLNPENYELAVEIAQIPESIRGFGHVKERNLKCARQRQNELMGRFRRPAASSEAA